LPTFDYAAVPGVAECTLDETTLADLPANDAPAPWDVELSGVVWWGRGGRRARAATGRPAHDRARAVAVIGGIVSYSRTPVGPYHEVYGAVGLRRGRQVVGTIPFMSVDSPRSLVGGRGNWSLPKCPAEFTGEPTGDRTLSARGAGWLVRVTVRPFGPRFPLPMKGTIEQPWPDGVLRRSELDGKARARLALVHVEVESEGELAGWLRPGRHLGAVLSPSSLTLSEAQ